jgi:hypothetical protein
MKAIRDGRAVADMTEDVDVRLSEEQKAAARRIVCANAQGEGLTEQAADAAELMRCLGVHPDQNDELDYLLGPQTRLNTLYADSGQPGW